MAHPHNEHRAHHVEHRRVSHILKGYGGHDLGKPHRADHTDEPEDRALVKAMVKPGALKHKAHGGKVKHRLDKPHRAKGGRVKHAKTNVNVIVGHGASGPPAMPVPVPAAGPPMAAVPRPPVPMPGMAPGLPPGIGGMAPPGAPPMGPRKAGGRTYKKGGRVKHRDEGGEVDASAQMRGNRPVTNAYGQMTYRQSGVKDALAASYPKGRASGGRVGRMPGYESTKKHATPVQHTDGKFPYVHEKRGKPVTYKRGGIVG